MSSTPTPDAVSRPSSRRRSRNAFSRFTVQIDLAFLVSGYYTFAVNGAFPSDNLVGLVVLGLVNGLGAETGLAVLQGLLRCH
jgi:hypothetical protein